MNDVTNKTIPEICPLSEAQRAVYLECISDPQSLMYNITASYRLPEKTNIGRFADAVRTAAQAHPAFCVTVSAPGGIPSMIYKIREVEVPVKECGNVDTEICDFARPFDLENGPLYRFEICRTPEGLFFLIDVHHLIFDGTSVLVFTQNIADAYSGRPIPEEALTLFDAAAAENGAKDEEKYRSDREFFDKLLGGFECDTKPVPDVVTDGFEGKVGRLDYPA